MNFVSRMFVFMPVISWEHLWTCPHQIVNENKFYDVNVFQVEKQNWIVLSTCGQKCLRCFINYCLWMLVYCIKNRSQWLYMEA